MSLEAGWYDDEADAALLRYWDGTAWTPHTAARPADAAPNPLRVVAAGAAASSVAPAPAAASTTAMPPAPAPAPDWPQVSSLGSAAAADDIDESTTVRPMGAPAPQPPADAWSPFAPPAAPTPFAPPAAPAQFAPPAAPSAQPMPPAYPFAAPAAFPPPPAAPSEFPSYTLPAPPGYALQEQTTAPLPPAYNAAAGPQFSYEPYRSTGRTFVATWLFAMLLGFWGADRFYLGKFGTAIAKLLTLGGLGIWVLVDLLLVLTGAQRDRDDRPLEGYDQHKRIAWIVTGGLVGLSLLSSIVSGVASLFVR